MRKETTEKVRQTVKRKRLQWHITLCEQESGDLVHVVVVYQFIVVRVCMLHMNILAIFCNFLPASATDVILYPISACALCCHRKQRTENSIKFHTNFVNDIQSNSDRISTLFFHILFNDRFSFNYSSYSSQPYTLLYSSSWHQAIHIHTRSTFSTRPGY